MRPSNDILDDRNWPGAERSLYIHRGHFDFGLRCVAVGGGVSQGLAIGPRQKDVAIPQTGKDADFERKPISAVRLDGILLAMDNH
jgi:hypothetical protein